MSHYIFNGKFIIPPGESIKELIEYKIEESKNEFNLTEFINALNISKEEFNALLSGNYPITNYIATALENLGYASKSFWINLENNYRKNLKEYYIHNDRN